MTSSVPIIIDVKDGDDPWPSESFNRTDSYINSTTLSDIALCFIGLFLAAIIFLSVAGNLLVCVAIYTDRSLRKIGNLFIVSLAISDLLVGCLVMVFAVANDLTGSWAFGPQLCDAWVACDVMCCTASILNLCAISLDRYIHIKDPLRYGRWMTKKIIYTSIAGIWFLAGFISFFPISLGLHKPEQPLEVDTEKVEPELQYCALDLTPLYAIVSSSISFYLPCLVMLAIYSRLFFYAKKHVKHIRATTRPLTLGVLEGDPRPCVTTATPCHVSDHKAALTLGIIMGVFLICWVPFFCINIVAAFCKTCIPPITFKILTWLGWSNSSFNPIIYSIFNVEFRESFRKILTNKFPALCCCQLGPCKRCRFYDNFPEPGTTNATTGGGSAWGSNHALRTFRSNSTTLQIKIGDHRESTDYSASPILTQSAQTRHGSVHQLIIEQTL